MVLAFGDLCCDFFKINFFTLKSATKIRNLTNYCSNHFFQRIGEIRNKYSRIRQIEVMLMIPNKDPIC